MLTIATSASKSDFEDLMHTVDIGYKEFVDHVVTSDDVEVCRTTLERLRCNGSCENDQLQCYGSAALQARPRSTAEQLAQDESVCGGGGHAG